MAQPDEAEARKILEELIADWRAIKAGGVNMRVRDSESVGVVVYALAAHVFYLAEAILHLYEQDLRPAAMPLIRQALECGYTAVWVETYGAEAARSLMHEQTRNELNTLTDFVAAGFPESPEAMASVQATLDSLAASASEPGRKFSERCADLAGGDVIYATYRVLSARSHASTSIVDLYVHPADVSAANPLGLSVSDEPQTRDEPSWLTFLLMMVVQAGLAWSRLDATHSQRTRLKALAKRLEVHAEPQQTGIGFKRANARDRAARKRSRDSARKSGK